MSRQNKFTHENNKLTIVLAFFFVARENHYQELVYGGRARKIIFLTLSLLRIKLARKIFQVTILEHREAWLARIFFHLFRLKFHRPPSASCQQMIQSGLTREARRTF